MRRSSASADRIALVFVCHQSLYRFTPPPKDLYFEGELALQHLISKFILQVTIAKGISSIMLTSGPGRLWASIRVCCCTFVLRRVWRHVGVQLLTECLLLLAHTLPDLRGAMGASRALLIHVTDVAATRFAPLPLSPMDTTSNSCSWRFMLLPGRASCRARRKLAQVTAPLAALPGRCAGHDGL